jgi:hypothetical protein
MNLSRFACLALLASSGAFAAVDPALMNLVMPDAKVLTGIQVDQSQASPFGRYVLSQMQFNDEGFQRFMNATGFDPRRDLREVLAAGTGQPDEHSGVVLGRGVFQPVRISAAAVAAGGTVTPYRGIDILSGRDAHGAVAFLDASIAVMGPPAMVREAIDRRLSGATFSGPLAQKANAASTTNHAWFVTVTPLSEFLHGRLANNPNLSGVSDSALLQNVLETSGGVNFGAGGVTISADAVTSSNQNAQALVDVMKFLVSLIHNNPQAGTLANAVTFSTSGPVMHMSLSLPEDQVEQLFMPRAARAKKAAAN